jgi:hypothetical protein
MAVAAIAYKQMAAADRKRIANMLRQHPDFAAKWKPGVAASGLPWDEYLFMQASIWPDTIRGNKQYDHPTWHYINKPYEPSDVRFKPNQPENVLTALDLNKRIAIDHTAEPADRAVALCWVFHLIGDLHQPLHAVTLVNELFPMGDRGGNDFYVRTPSGTMNLHTYWDGLFDQYQSPAQIDAFATRILAARKRPDLLEMETRTADGWVYESLSLAVAAAYNHTPDPLHSYERTPLTPAKTAETATPLPEGYDANAHANGERRVALAGFRLAGVLGGLLYGQP